MSRRRLEIFEKKYTLVVLAEMAATDGDRIAALAHRTGATRPALGTTLRHLAARGWARKNPGYGHPLRPEYVLTPAGRRIAGLCAEVDRRLRVRDAREAATRKWTLPVLDAIGSGRTRFSGIAREFPGLTDRALSQALAQLVGHGLVERRILDERPPATEYRPTAAARRILPALQRLLAA